MKIKLDKDLNEIRRHAQKMLEDIWTDRAPELWQDYKADMDYYIIKAYEAGRRDSAKQRE